jgi:tetratricopeptide (TPR) repeat protein
MRARTRSLLLVGLLGCGCAAQQTGAGPAAPAAGAAPASREGAPPDEPAAAVRFFEARVARGPEDLEAWQRLAISLRRVNRLQEAARAAWRAVEIEASPESWTALGNVLMQGQARAGAFAAFEMAAVHATDKDYIARNFLNLGYRDWAWGNTKGAAQAIDRAEKASPENPQVFYDRATLLAGTGHPAEGAAAAKRALELLAPVPVEKLPTQEARDAIKVMRELLQRIADRKDVPERPLITESGQELPERFSKDNVGHARELAIDPVSYRFYPAGARHLFRIEVPARWNERVEVGKEATEIKIEADDDPPRGVLQITAVLPLDGTVDLHAAAEKGAEVVRGAGGVVEAVQPLGKGSFGFWSKDPRAKPGERGDYPFLAQSFSQNKGLVLSATYLTRTESPDERAVLTKLVERAGVVKMDR